MTVVGATAPEAGVRIDAIFPGGNIVVERIDGDNIFLHRDLRETAGQWFYWCFRVRGAEGRTLTFNFTQGNVVVAARGPALSTDGGLTWTWLGMDRVKGVTFSHAFPPDAADVLFSVGMTYTEQNLRAFLARVGARSGFAIGTLGRSEKGRDVELLHVGKLEGTPAHRVAITARHHACEMMASYVLEGIVEGILADTVTGRWLRENVGFLFVPFMDKDGVEDGLQGKNRLPHDPARDYVGDSIYPTVAAIKRLLPVWSDGRLRIALDLHCPTLSGNNAENTFFVLGPNAIIAKRVGRFSNLLAAGGQTGPLVHRTSDNILHGKLWNTLMEPKSFGLWAAELPEISISTTLEIPYAVVRGVEVNAQTARAFGQGVARAIHEYLITE